MCTVCRNNVPQPTAQPRRPSYPTTPPLAGASALVSWSFRRWHPFLYPRLNDNYKSQLHAVMNGDLADLSDLSDEVAHYAVPEASVDLPHEWLNSTPSVQMLHGWATAVEDEADEMRVALVKVSASLGDLAILGSLMEAWQSQGCRLPGYGDRISQEECVISAARSGCPASVRLLLDHGLNPDSTDCDGVTALMTACEHGHHECAEELLRAGARVDMTRDDRWMTGDLGITALMSCAEDIYRGRAEDSVACMQLLLKWGATVSLVDYEGRSALDYVETNLALLVQSPPPGYGQGIAPDDVRFLNSLTAPDVVRHVRIYREAATLLRRWPTWKRLRTVYVWTARIRPACLAWKQRAAERAYAPGGCGFKSVLAGPQALAYGAWQITDAV